MRRITLSLLLIFVSALTEKCDKDFDVHLNMIILTHASEKNGATFIRKLMVDSLDQCLKHCCDTSGCTVGIYGPKRRSVCFLFNCQKPNVCNFTTDLDYSVLVRHSSLPDLLKISKVDTHPQGTLHGACSPQMPCAGVNSICDSGQCVCKPGFVAKENDCVLSFCSKPELQFQCDDATACIALYDVCNGVTECPDGSDEASCSKETHISENLKPTLAHKSDTQGLARPRFLNEPTFLLRHGEQRKTLENHYDSEKERPLRKLKFAPDFSSRHIYGSDKEYFPSAYFGSLESETSSVLLPEAHKKYEHSEDAVSQLLDGSHRFRSRSGYPTHFIEDSYTPNEQILSEHRKLTVGRLPTRSHYVPIRYLDEGDEKYPHARYRSNDFSRRPKLRHRKTEPLVEHSSSKRFDEIQPDNQHDSRKEARLLQRPHLVHSHRAVISGTSPQFFWPFVWV